MKKLLISAAVIALPLTASAGSIYTSVTGEYIAKAQAGGDANAEGMSAPVHVDFKDGLGGTVALGYNITDEIRAELEGGYRQLNGHTTSVKINGGTYVADTSSNDERALSGMGNVYYNLPTGSKVSPYIGAGLGMIREQNSGSSALAYQGMVGVDYKVSKNGTVFTGYRYLGTTEMKPSFHIEGEQVNERVGASIQAIDVGYRYNF